MDGGGLKNDGHRHLEQNTLASRGLGRLSGSRRDDANGGFELGGRIAFPPLSSGGSTTLWGFPCCVRFPGSVNLGLLERMERVKQSIK